MYLTPAQLADLPGAMEVAQAATPQQDRTVDTQLMELTLVGGDRSAYSAGDVAVADAVLSRVNNAIAEASGYIDGFLARRYVLPLASPPAILTSFCRAIVRYKLNAHLVSDEKTSPIARDYRDAQTTLQQIADGEFSIGVDDPQSAAEAPLDVQFDPGQKVFHRDALRNC